MNKQASNTSLFILSSVASEEHRQGFVNGLFHTAEHARLASEFGILEQTVDAMNKVRLITHEQETANYYTGFLALIKGHPAQAKKLLEGAAERGSLQVRARALSSLAFMGRIAGDFDLANELYTQSQKIASRNGSLEWAYWYSYKDRCQLVGITGDHKGAVRLLEEGLPAARYIGLHHPYVYYDYLNSYAVELADMSRLEEAAAVIRPVARSPLLKNFPAWQDTLMSIRRSQRGASRAIVAVPDVVGNHRVLDYCEYVSHRTPNKQLGLNEIIDPKVELIEDLLDHVSLSSDLMKIITKILE